MRLEAINRSLAAHLGPKHALLTSQDARAPAGSATPSPRTPARNGTIGNLSLRPSGVSADFRPANSGAAGIGASIASASAAAAHPGRQAGSGVPAPLAPSHLSSKVNGDGGPWADALQAALQGGRDSPAGLPTGGDVRISLLQAR